MATEDKPSKPNLNEIATVGDGRDLTRPYIQPLLIPQDLILTGKGAGDLQLYEKVLEDEQVKSCLQQRFSALTSKEWEVLPGGEKRIDQKAAEFVRGQLERLDWDAITEKMAYGVFYGFSIAECLWKQEDGQVVLETIKVRNRRRFKFDAQFRPRLITLQNQFYGEELPPRKFWHFSFGGDNADQPYGMGLAHWLYWLVFFKRNDIRFWLGWLESLARGRRIGKYPPGATKEEQAKLLKAVDALGEDTAAVIPEGMLVEFIEMAKNTADYSTLWDKMNAAISKVILSQTMTTDDGSSLAQAKVHEGVKESVVKADSDLINSSFNQSVVKWLVDFNYPGAAYPRVWRRVEEESDLKPQAERDNIIISWGYRPTPEYVRSTYGNGFVAPDEQGEGGQPVVLNGAQMQALLELLTRAGQEAWSKSKLQTVLSLVLPQLPEEVLTHLVEQENKEQAAAGDQVPGQEAQQPTTQPPSLDQVATLFADSADSVEFAASGGKKCKKGVSCGNTCISAKKTCRKTLSAASQQSAKQVKKAATGGGTGGASAASTPSDVSRIKDALDIGDYSQVLDLADQVYDRAKKLATVKGWDFYAGITAGNGSDSDALLTELFRSAGYDGKPQLVGASQFDQLAKTKGGRVLYRAPTSNPSNVQKRFDDFAQGDYDARKGIYGHGTYVAMASSTNTRQRRSASSDASHYGKAGMRMYIPPTARVISHTDMTKLYNQIKTDLDRWVSTQRSKIPQNQQRQFDAKVRRTQEVLFGDWDIKQGSTPPPASGRLAVIMGYDVVHLNKAYNSRYALLLNRSILTMDRNVVQLGKNI